MFIPCLATFSDTPPDYGTKSKFLRMIVKVPTLAQKNGPSPPGPNLFFQSYILALIHTNFMPQPNQTFQFFKYAVYVYTFFMYAGLSA